MRRGPASTWSLGLTTQSDAALGLDFVAVLAALGPQLAQVEPSAFHGNKTPC